MNASENSFEFWPPACSRKRRGSFVPGLDYAGNAAFVPATCPSIVNVMPDVGKAAPCRAARGGA